MPRNEPFAYYRLKRIRPDLSRPPTGTNQPVPRKVCECRHVNPTTATACYRCNKELRRRPGKRRQRTVDQRLAIERELLDAWLTKLSLANTKVQYYRKRCRTLEREQVTGPRPARPRRARGIRERAIRVREESPPTE